MAVEQDHAVALTQAVPSLRRRLQLRWHHLLRPEHDRPFMALAAFVVIMAYAQVGAANHTAVHRANRARGAANAVQSRVSQITQRLARYASTTTIAVWADESGFKFEPIAPFVRKPSAQRAAPTRNVPTPDHFYVRVLPVQ